MHAFYGSLLWTKIGHLAFHTNLYPITVFGSIILDSFPTDIEYSRSWWTVLWIDYYGSCILDRVFWDYYGSCILDRLSCILDRLLWIVHFGSCILD